MSNGFKKTPKAMVPEIMSFKAFHAAYVKFVKDEALRMAANRLSPIAIAVFSQYGRLEVMRPWIPVITP